MIHITIPFFVGMLAVATARSSAIRDKANAPGDDTGDEVSAHPMT